MGKLEDAKELLKSYMSAMNEWELECEGWCKSMIEEKLSVEEFDRLTKSSYAIVFNKYCALSQEQSISRHGGVYSDPPGYDPDLEVVLECRELEDGSVEIRTKRKDDTLKQQFVYLLKEEDGELRLFGKKYVDRLGEGEAIL